VTQGNQPGKGTGSGRHRGDSASPRALSLAVLECDESEVEAHLAALDVLVEAASGTMALTEVTSTCLAISIDAPPAALLRLAAALKLGGATVLPCAARSHDVFVILAVRQPIKQDFPT
jgi:hypothetical protein